MYVRRLARDQHGPRIMKAKESTQWSRWKLAHPPHGRQLRKPLVIQSFPLLLLQDGALLRLVAPSLALNPMHTSLG